MEVGWIPETAWRYVLTTCSLVFLSLLVVRNLLTLMFLRSVYFKTKLNVSEMVTIATTLGYIVVSAVAADGNQAQVHLGAISIFVAWFNLTLLIGSLPSAGIYIQMVVKV